ncbi:flagella cluster protein [Haloferax namakaokahaiae]|uniref:Flagella cluster protein n=1 Tax=Haloferax namakaokahaiae TaxID=1748331 RepID=A0ABD5ZAA6_9EURY
MAATFDIHEVRHRVKMLRDTGTTMVVENRDGVACPACGDAFTELLISEAANHSFDVPPQTRLCVHNETETGRVLIATHQ